MVVSKFQTVPQHIPLNEGKCCSSIAVLSYQSAWSSETTLHTFWIARGNGNQGNSEQNTATVKGGWAGCFCCCYISESPACSEPSSKQDLQFGVRGRSSEVFWKCLVHLTQNAEHFSWKTSLLHVQYIEEQYLRFNPRKFMPKITFKIFLLWTCPKSMQSYRGYGHRTCRSTLSP